MATMYVTQYRRMVTTWRGGPHDEWFTFNQLSKSAKEALDKIKQHRDKTLPFFDKPVSTENGIEVYATDIAQFRFIPIEVPTEISNAGENKYD